jgi:hypothetical protein
MISQRKGLRIDPRKEEVHLGRRYIDVAGMLSPLYAFDDFTCSYPLETRQFIGIHELNMPVTQFDVRLAA